MLYVSLTICVLLFIINVIKEQVVLKTWKNSYLSLLVFNMLAVNELLLAYHIHESMNYVLKLLLYYLNHFSTRHSWHKSGQQNIQSLSFFIMIKFVEENNRSNKNGYTPDQEQYIFCEANYVFHDSFKQFVNHIFEISSSIYASKSWFT